MDVDRGGIMCRQREKSITYMTERPHSDYYPNLRLAPEL